MCFTLAVAFFALIAGSYKNIEKYLGCRTELPRMFKAWSSLDQYFINLDQLLCSNGTYPEIDGIKACPCNINEKGMKIFNGSIITNPYIEQKVWTISPSGTNVVDKCPSFDLVTQNFNEFDSIYGRRDQIDSKKFKKYWKKIEKKFDCTGFCNTVYVDSLNQPRKMYKYLFSGIERGIPEHYGCMNEIMKYLHRLLLSYGSFALLSGVCQLAIFFFTCKAIITQSEIEAIKQLQSSKVNIPKTQEEH